MANIERTYHDVTTLDKGIALNKVKDIMDISSSAEFFTVVKDPQSIIPHNYEKLTYESGYNEWTHYFKPFTRYKFERNRSDTNIVRQFTSKLGLRIKLLNYEFEDDTNFVHSDQVTKSWAKNKTTIMHHCRGMWLLPDTDNGAVLYFTPVYDVFFSRNNVIQIDGEVLSTVQAGAHEAHASIPLSKVLLLEFEVYDVVDSSRDATSRISSHDQSTFFNYFKRDLYNTDDFADVLMLTQSNANRYSLVVRNVLESRPNSNYNTVQALYDIIADVYGRMGQYANLDLAEILIKSHIDSSFNISTDVNKAYFAKLNKGPIYIGDNFDENAGSFESYICKKIESNEGYVLLSDLNQHAASLLAAVLTATNFSVSLHTHNSTQLFKNAAFNTITHPTGKPLLIGSPADYAGGISFVESINLLNNRITGASYIETEDLKSTGTINGRDVTISSTLTVHNNNNDAQSTLDNLTLNGTLNLQGGSISLSNMPSNKAASNDIANKNVLIVGSDGIISKIVNNNTILGTLSNVSAALSESYGATNASNQPIYNREFFARDGSFRALSPVYLGAADRSHWHGDPNTQYGMNNDGQLPLERAISGTEDHIVFTKGSTHTLARSGLAFGTNDAENKRLLLSKYGSWSSIKDILYRFGGTGDAAYGGTTDINTLTQVGIYKVGAATTTNHGPRVINGSSDTTSWESRYLNEGSIITLTNNGEAHTNNSNSNRIIQIGFGYNQTIYGGNNSSVTSAADTLFLRSKSTNGNWTDWTYLARHDHNHDKEYTKLSATGTNVLAGVNIYDNTGNFTDSSSNYYQIAYEASTHEAKHDIKDSSGKFVWDIASGLIMSLDGTNGLVLDNNASVQNLNVTGTVTFNKTTGGTIIPNAGNNDTILFASPESSNKRELHASTFKLSDLTALNTNFANHTNQNSGNTAAHGEIKSNGTMPGTAQTIVTNDYVAVVQANGSKLVKSKIQFDTNDANKTSYLAKTGAWITLPGDLKTSDTMGTAGSTAGNTYDASHGFITGADIRKLNTIYNSYSLADSDTTINTLKDILDAFSGSAEDLNIATRLSAIDTATAAKLPLAGGNMTGNIGFKDANGNTKTMIKFLTGDVNGHGIAIGGGAKTIIGSGEATGLYESGPTAEDLYLVSDNNVYIKSACQNGDSSSKTITFSTDGKLTLPGKVVIQSTEDVNLGTANSGGLLVGNVSGEHIAIDGNEIMAKANGTTVGSLYLNNQGGTVYLGGSNAYASGGVLYSEGNKVVTTVSASGTGLSGGVTAANSTGTITLDSSSAGNAAANKVVLRNAAGSIQSEKFAVSSGTTTKATMQYNSTEDCIEFIFA